MGEQHLLAPLPERGAEFAAEQPRDRARAGTGVARERLDGRPAGRLFEHRFAERAQALVGRQVDAQAHRHSGAQLVQDQRGEVLLARRRRRAAGCDVEVQHQLAQQLGHLEHTARLPQHHGGMHVERADVGVVDRGHHMFDIGRDRSSRPKNVC